MKLLTLVVVSVTLRVMKTMTHDIQSETQVDGRVSRVTLPTASFSLTTYLIAWIEEEARRRGVKKSVLVREILTAEMEKQEASAA